jgi:hypothetical protein
VLTHFGSRAGVRSPQVSLTRRQTGAVFDIAMSRFHSWTLRTRFLCLLSGLIGICFIISCFLTRGYMANGALFAFHHGSVSLIFLPGIRHAGWIEISGATANYQWWPGMERDKLGSIIGIWVPLWIPFLAAVLTTILSQLLRSKDKVLRCNTCGYNLTGNTTGICPECGNVQRNIAD